MRNFGRVVTLVALSVLSFANSAVSGEISELYRQDQETRGNFKDGDGYDRASEALGDSARRVRIFEILAERLSLNSEELVQVSTILQHTNTDWPEESGELAKSQDNHILAYFLARRAWIEGHKDGGWLMCAAVARWLRISGLPLALGITSKKVGGSTEVVLLSPLMSDEERMRAGFPFKLNRSLETQKPNYEIKRTPDGAFRPNHH